MSDIPQLINELKAFRDARDWRQFHNPKDLALALSIEAAELAELYLWKKEAELDQVDRRRVAEELADVLAYALLLADHYGFAVAEIIQNKIKKNEAKYPVEKSKGSARKYDEL